MLETVVVDSTDTPHTWPNDAEIVVPVGSFMYNVPGGVVGWWYVGNQNVMSPGVYILDVVHKPWRCDATVFNRVNPTSHTTFDIFIA